MATKFRETQARYGPDSVGVISTGQLVTEEFYALGKLVQLGIGTRNIDGNTTLCMATAVSGYKRSFGSDGPPGAYEDLERADVIVLIGANVAENHPILCWRLRSNPNNTLIVVDPRVTKTAMLADLHLPLKPRSDLALINGLIHFVIENDLVDHEYVARHTTGFDALRESVRAYTPERVAEITGLSCRVDLPDGMDLRACPRRVHRLDDGRQPQHQGHRDGQRDQQPRAHHRQHRARRCGAVLDHRPVQCHGDARGRVCVEPAGLSQVRERRRSARAGTALGHFRGAHSECARPRVSRHHRGGARSTHSCVVDHRDQPRRLVSQLRLAPPGARVARFPRRAGRVSPDSDIGIRAPDAARGDVGREGRDLHQLRAAGEQGQSRGAAAR